MQTLRVFENGAPKHNEGSTSIRLEEGGSGPTNAELREDGGFELREDGGYELRE